MFGLTGRWIGCNGEKEKRRCQGQCIGEYREEQGFLVVGVIVSVRVWQNLEKWAVVSQANAVPELPEWLNLSSEGACTEAKSSR